jgi:hypothetical protein
VIESPNVLPHAPAMVPSDSNASPERTDPSHPCPTLTDTEASQAIEQIELKAIHKLCRHHKDRAAAWFAGMFVSLPVGGMIAIPARTSTAWGTWMINRQSNLILCFAGLCLVMCLGHSARLIYLASSGKRP